MQMNVDTKNKLQALHCLLDKELLLLSEQLSTDPDNQAQFYSNSQYQKQRGSARSSQPDHHHHHQQQQYQQQQNQKGNFEQFEHEDEEEEEAEVSARFENEKQLNPETEQHNGVNSSRDEDYDLQSDQLDLEEEQGNQHEELNDNQEEEAVENQAYENSNDEEDENNSLNEEPDMQFDQDNENDDDDEQYYSHNPNIPQNDQSIATSTAAAAAASTPQLHQLPPKSTQSMPPLRHFTDSDYENSHQQQQFDRQQLSKQSGTANEERMNYQVKIVSSQKDTVEHDNNLQGRPKHEQKGNGENKSGLYFTLQQGNQSLSTTPSQELKHLQQQQRYVQLHQSHSGTYTLQAPVSRASDSCSETQQAPSNAHLSKEIQGLQQKIQFLEEKLKHTTAKGYPTTPSDRIPSSIIRDTVSSVGKQLSYLNYSQQLQQHQQSGLKSMLESSVGRNEGSVEKGKRRIPLSSAKGFQTVSIMTNSAVTQGTGNYFTCATPSSMFNSTVKTKKHAKPKYAELQRQIDSAEMSLDVSKAAWSSNKNQEVHTQQQRTTTTKRKERSSSWNPRNRSQSIGSSQRRSREQRADQISQSYLIPEQMQSNNPTTALHQKYQFVNSNNMHASGYAEVLELKKLISQVKSTYQREREVLCEERKKRAELATHIQQVELKQKKVQILLERSSQAEQSYQELAEQYEKSHQIRTHQNGLINQLKTHIDLLKQQQLNNLNQRSTTTTASSFSHRK